MSLATLRFHTKALYTGQTGIVDEQNFTIKGVSCITGNSEAEGHSLFVDDTTIQQLHALAKEKGQVPVTLDHDGGIGDVNGYVHNFRVDGDKLRADWVLLENHPETKVMLERAQKQPSTFGLSFSFKGDPKGTTVGNRQCARAEDVISCDCVKRPAANKGGLFSTKDGPTDAEKIQAMIELCQAPSLDTRNFSERSKQILFNMPNNPNQPAASLDDVMNAIQGLSSRIEAAEQQNAEIIDRINGQGQQEQEQGTDAERFELLSQLNAMTDEELAEQGITRDQVNAEVNAYNESVGGERAGEQGGEQFQGGEQGGEQFAIAGAESSAGTSGAAFSALQRQVIALSNEIKAGKVREAKNAEAIEFQAVDQKIVALATQRDEAIKLAESLVAENEALRLHVKTGTRPAPAGVDGGGNILFGAMSDGQLHPWQAKVKQIELAQKVSPGKAIQLCDKEDGGALHRDYINSLAKDRTINA